MYLFLVYVEYHFDFENLREGSFFKMEIQFLNIPNLRLFYKKEFNIITSMLVNNNGP